MIPSTRKLAVQECKNSVQSQLRGGDETFSLSDQPKDLLPCMVKLENPALANLASMWLRNRQKAANTTGQFPTPRHGFPGIQRGLLCPNQLSNMQLSHYSPINDQQFLSLASKSTPKEMSRPRHRVGSCMVDSGLHVF